MRISNKNISLQHTYLEVDQSDQALWDRFLKYVVTTSDCWIWTGSQSVSGSSGKYYYGSFRLSPRKMTYAHRMSYALYKGPIPHGMVVMHTCDNPLCVNPDHLVLGTHKQNSEDAVQKGRIKNCEDHGRAKLTNKQVLNIRKLDGQMRRKDIAKLFKVSPSLISAILNGHLWKGLKNED